MRGVAEGQTRLKEFESACTHRFVCGVCRAEHGLTAAFNATYETSIDPCPTPPTPQLVQADTTAEPGSDSADSDSARSNVPTTDATDSTPDTALVIKGKDAYTRSRYLPRADGAQTQLEFYASKADCDAGKPPVAKLLSDVRTRCQQVVTREGAPGGFTRARWQYVLRAADAEYASAWRAQEERRTKKT